MRSTILSAAAFLGLSAPWVHAAPISFTSDPIQYVVQECVGWSFCPSNPTIVELTLSGTIEIPDLTQDGSLGFLQVQGASFVTSLPLVFAPPTAREIVATYTAPQAGGVGSLRLDSFDYSPGSAGLTPTLDLFATVSPSILISILSTTVPSSANIASFVATRLAPGPVSAAISPVLGIPLPTGLPMLAGALATLVLVRQLRAA